MADLLNEVDGLKRMNNSLRAEINVTNDQNHVIRAVSGVIDETGQVFKKKIVQDRKYMDKMFDMKDNEYARIRVTYYNIE